MQHPFAKSHVLSQVNLSFRNNPNVTHRTNILRDALGSLNHLCRVQDKSRVCLEESAISEHYTDTLAAGGAGRFLQLNFQFICHQQRRDENLVRSLQCLYDTRVLAMLFFHIANRCHGTAILDDVMTRYKNAYFYTLDVKPVWGRPVVSPLTVLSSKVSYIHLY